LYKDGIFQTILLDNFFPTFNTHVNRVRKANGEELGKEGEPIFAAAYGNELWVALAEKAYAKAHHGYVIIAGGSCGPTMRDLCGAPAYTYIFEEGDYPEDLWDRIIQGENMQYAMSAGTPGVDEGQYDDKGIVPGHAYSLLAARTITDKYGEQVNLVQMRNPWKEGEWTGRFSDHDDEWTEELREALNHYPRDDGIFWMTFEDMVKTFDQVDICKVDDPCEVFLHGG
jgi:calpain-15